MNWHYKLLYVVAIYRILFCLTFNIQENISTESDEQKSKRLTDIRHAQAVHLFGQKQYSKAFDLFAQINAGRRAQIHCVYSINNYRSTIRDWSSARHATIRVARKYTISK
jgi:hypothetical protein